MAMLGVFANTNVMALGLGEIELKSALNQPLDAEVELLSATGPELGELKVALASGQAFANAGIERTLFLNKLQFSVGHNTAGTPVVRISSRDVVREPFLDFLLEMSWSKGRLVREYTVLVDPPVTMPGGAPAVVQAPGSATLATASSGAVNTVPADRVSHTARLPPLSVSSGEYGPTRHNDTLWSVAESVRPDTGVSIEQTMLGLLRANPEAFIDNNINNLKEGYVLRIPSREELTSISRAAAVRESRAQYAVWRAAHAQTSPDAGAAADEQGATAVNPASVAGEPSLQLVAPDASDAAVVGTPGGEDLSTLQNDLVMTNEALEEQRRQSEEMSSRLSMLEEQITNMQRLIQLKDNELARLQALSSGGVTDTATAGVAENPASGADVPLEDGAQEASAPVVGEGVGSDTPAVDAIASSADVVADIMDAADSQIPADTAAVAEAVPEDAGLVTTESADIPADETAADETIADETTDESGATESVVAGQPARIAAAPETPFAVNSPAFVERLLANPLWLGGGAVILALLAFFGLRRKRGVETEFQESILEATQPGSGEADDESVVARSEPASGKATESSLLSEFAVSDMGSIRNDGEADPLAEADVYLAYGRYQQAEHLIRDALEKDAERDDLNLKLLEVFTATRDQAAFDEHARGLLERFGDSSHPVWEKVAEMGRELSPANALYQAGAADGEQVAPLSSHDQAPVDEQDADEVDAEGLDFDIDLSFDPSADADQPDSAAFDPSADATQPDPGAFDPEPADDAIPVEPDVLADDNALEFDLEGFDFEAANEVADEPPGDGQLSDLDEVATKLDLARAYIDMGDPDGAKSILDEVMEEGSDDQKDEARDIMTQMS